MNDALTLVKINLTELLKEKITYVLLIMHFCFILFSPNIGHYISFSFFYSFINTCTNQKSFTNRIPHKISIILPIKRDSIILEYYINIFIISLVTVFYIVLTNILGFSEYNLLNLTLFYMTILFITASVIIPIIIKYKNKISLINFIALIPFVFVLSIPNLDTLWFLNFINKTSSIIFVIILIISSFASLYISYTISKKIFKTYEILN